MFSDGPVLDGVEVTVDKEREPIPSTSGIQTVHESPMEVDTPIRDEGFGGHLEQNIICKIMFLKDPFAVLVINKRPLFSMINYRNVITLCG